MKRWITTFWTKNKSQLYNGDVCAEFCAVCISVCAHIDGDWLRHTHCVIHAYIKSIKSHVYRTECENSAWFVSNSIEWSSWINHMQMKCVFDVTTKAPLTQAECDRQRQKTKTQVIQITAVHSPHGTNKHRMSERRTPNILNANVEWFKRLNEPHWTEPYIN